MRKQRSLLFAALVIAVGMLLFPVQTWSQLPPGIKAEVVSKYSSSISGIKEIRLVKFTFQPGAVLKDFKVKNQGLCNSTQGTFAVLNQDTGEANYYAPGSRWVNTKDATYTIANPGDEVAIQFVYSLIGK